MVRIVLFLLLIKSILLPDTISEISFEIINNKINKLIFDEQKAKVKVKIEAKKTSYLCGEEGSFKIVVQGAELASVVFPTLRWLDGQFIEDRDYIDKNESSVFKRFKFQATNSFTIPKLKIVVNKQIYYTKPLHIKVEIPKILKGKINCKSYYSINEYLQNFPFRFTQVCVAWDKNIKLEYIERPVLWDFDVVKEDIGTQKLALDNDVYFKRYILSPYKSGKLSIPNSLVKISYLGKTLYYPILNYSPIEFKPLPKGVYLAGKYEIASKKISNERIEVEVKGVGSCDNISEFELVLPDAIVTKEMAKTINIVDSKRNICKIYFKEVFFIKTDKNIIIEPFELTFFDPKTNRLKTIKTKELFFEKNLFLEPKRKEIEQKKELDLKKAFILFYVMSIFILFLLREYLKRLFLSSKPAKELEEADSLEKLYELLIKYAKDERLLKYITDLEKVIYEKQEIEIDKKEIVKELSYEIVGKQKVLILKMLTFLLIGLIVGFIPLVGVLK